MTNDNLNALLMALESSPANVPLRKLVVKELFALDRYAEAESHLKFILPIAPNDLETKQLMAEVYFRGKSFSAAIIILEELMGMSDLPLKYRLLYSKALLKEGSVASAKEIYLQIIFENPNFSDEELDNEFKVGSMATESPYDHDFVNQALGMVKPQIDFSQVGGMADVKREIELKIIKPYKHPELYKAYGKKIGGGILLYGPPGCGKTHIAKATAGEVKANFISIGINDILDAWLGNSEKNLHAIFETARQNTPCVLFIDEVDALGANRSDMKGAAGRNVINQFLSELDGVEDDNDGVLILAATNSPWHLDPAFKRPGRFDRMILVSPPDQMAREEILKIILKDKPIKDIDYAKISKKTKDFSGADLKDIVDKSIELKLEKAFETGEVAPLVTSDILKSLDNSMASTKEWFSKAKNYALYSNESGLYDSILNYLKISK
jgi:SpoVK/Ycf46/Vps4 family AAA+-type ATPase